MELNELLKQNFTGKTIVIIGPPASGKTYITEQLNPYIPDHIIVDTDKYMEYGFKESLYKLLENIVSHEKEKPHIPLCIVGMLGYRLLRKGVEQGNFYPDVVINIATDIAKITEVYEKEREPGKLKGALSMIKASETILNSYFDLNSPKDPEWIDVENNY